MDIISATELKNKTSEVLNDVYYGNKDIVVEKHGKPIAKIVPIEERKHDLSKVLDEYFGVLPDFPEVTKYRRSRKKSLSL